MSSSGNAVRWTRIALILLVVFAAAGIALRWTAHARDASTVFLLDEGEARWVGFRSPFSPRLHPLGSSRVFLRHQFELAEPLTEWALRVRMMKWGRGFLDGRPIFESSPPSDAEAGPSAGWKAPRRIESGEPLEAGVHVLLFVVQNQGGPSLLLVGSDDLPVETGTSWEASADGQSWLTAWPATQPKSHSFDEPFPDTVEALRERGVWFAGLFAVTFGLLALQSGRGTPLGSSLRPDAAVRIVLLGAWALLGVVNVARVPPNLGYDAVAHLAYVQFIAENGALPLASDGWQAFQPPLYYLLATPLYLLFGVGQDFPLQMALLRSISLLSGLALVEIGYRTSLLAFPERADLRALATLVAGMMPMTLYMAQHPGNEPLAGALAALALLPALALIREPERPRSTWFFVGMGALWGLAVLAKVTPLLLGPGLGFALLWHSARCGDTPGRVVGKALAFGGAALAFCGWFFVRNILAFGKPFIGGWEPYSTPGWWQDPGYRTLSQYLEFGRSLSEPAYAGTRGLWDALYSTVWLDGFASGTNPADLPWNHDLMVLGALLGVVPTLLILGSLGTLWRAALRRSRGALLLAAGCLGVYLVAVIDLHLRLPIYSTAKGSYLVGLSPALGLLAAAGAEPLLRQRWLRAAVVAWLVSWAVVAFVAYIVMPGSGGAP